MHWLFYAVIVISGAVGIHVFSKLSKDLIDPIYIMALTGICYVAIGLGAFFAADWKKYISETPSVGMLWGGLAALSVVIANSAVLFMYRAGAPVSIAMPFTRFSAALVAVLIGVLILKEPFTLQKTVGFVLAFLGVFLLVK